MSSAKKSSTPAQTVGRAIHLLKIIASSHTDNLRLIDIASMASLDKSTAHRLLQRLVSERMLVRDPVRGYKLGPLLYELGLASMPDTNLPELSETALQQLAHNTGDMVFLVVRSGFESVCLSRIAGHFPIQTMTRTEGDRHPLGMGAGGLAILAAMHDSDIDITIQAIRPRLPAYQLTEESLREAIAKTRARSGLAMDEGTAALDVCAIGQPIYDRSQAPVAAVFVASIRHRMMEERQKQVTRHLDNCVKAIEKSLRQA